MWSGWNNGHANNHFQQNGFDFGNFMSQLPYFDFPNRMGEFAEEASSWLGNSPNPRGPSNPQPDRSSNNNRNPFTNNTAHRQHSNLGGGAQTGNPTSDQRPQPNRGSCPYNPFEDRPNRPTNPFTEQQAYRPAQAPQHSSTQPQSQRTPNPHQNPGRPDPPSQPQHPRAPADELAGRMGERIKANNAKQPLHNNFFGGANKSHIVPEEDSRTGGLLDGRMGERIKPNSGTTFGSTSSREYCYC